MNTIRKLRNMIAGTALAAATIAAPQEAVAQEAKPLEFKVEETFSASPVLSEKLRTTISQGRWLFRYDGNAGKQDQWMLNTTILSGDRSLAITQAGDMSEDKKATYAIGVIGSQKVKLPLLGDSRVKAMQLNQWGQGRKPFSKTILGAYGEHIDLVGQAKVNSKEPFDMQGYVAVHTDKVHASLGKAEGDVLEYVGLTKNMPRLGIALWGDYNWNDGTFNLYCQNAYSKADKDFFSQGNASYASDLLTLGTVAVNYPRFTSYQTRGGLISRVAMQKTKENKRSLEAQVGVEVAKGLWLGAGVYGARERGQSDLGPAFSATVKKPVGKLTLYAEASLKGGKLGAYSYVQGRF